MWCKPKANRKGGGEEVIYLATKKHRERTRKENSSSLEKILVSGVFNSIYEPCNCT